jgi:hypothetical protein
MVEFTLVLPVIMIILLAAVDFGRLMQARVTAEAATRAGAAWGAGILANSTQPLDPVFAFSNSKCGFGPTCNIEARACDEAAGIPGYSGGPALQGSGANPVTYHDCAKNYASSTNVVGSVCSPTATQSNPFLVVTWRHADSTIFTPTAVAPAVVGDTIEVVGTFCFKTLIPWPLVPKQITWTDTSRFTVQP